MMTEDRLIELAAQIGLGRAMKPIGMQTGDVFATEQGYRTDELLAFAAAVRSDVAAQAADRVRATVIVDGEPPEKLREAIAQRVADVGKPTGA